MRMRTAMPWTGGSGSPNAAPQSDPGERPEGLGAGRQRRGEAGLPGKPGATRVATSPTEINRRDLARQVTVSANLDDLPIGTAVSMWSPPQADRHAARLYRQPLREAEDLAESFGYMGESLLLAVIFVYLILAAQFESFFEPWRSCWRFALHRRMAGMLKLTGDTVNIMSLTA